MPVRFPSKLLRVVASGLERENIESLNWTADFLQFAVCSKISISLSLSLSLRESGLQGHNLHSFEVTDFLNWVH